MLNFVAGKMCSTSIKMEFSCRIRQGACDEEPEQSEGNRLHVRSAIAATCRKDKADFERKKRQKKILPALMRAKYAALR